MKFYRVVITPISLVFCLSSTSILANDSLTVTVKNQSGNFVKDVVISAYLKKDKETLLAALKDIKIIDQIDKEFIAHVLPIQRGTSINFPNHDQIRHHVYSFSPTKKFEIPLYEGTPAQPIIFDKTGVVTLGCNIHDWMSAYIYIVDTPYFTMTDTNGIAKLTLPKGDYSLQFWHPNIDEKRADIHESISVNTNSIHAIPIQMNIKKMWSIRRGPFSRLNQGRYR
jgi:plastocyanin